MDSLKLPEPVMPDRNRSAVRPAIRLHAAMLPVLLGPLAALAAPASTDAFERYEHAVALEKALEARLASTCDIARELTDGILNARARSLTDTQLHAARAASQRCEQQRAQLTPELLLARQATGEARSKLRQANAAPSAAPPAPPPLPQARSAAAPVDPVASASNPDQKRRAACLAMVDPKIEFPAIKTDGDLMDEAGKAMGKVGSMRGSFKGLYDTVNEAGSTALKMPVARPRGDDALRGASALEHKADLASALLSCAQKEAVSFRQQATLMRCARTGERCEDENGKVMEASSVEHFRTQALDAHRLMMLALGTAEKRMDEARGAALNIEAEHANLDEKQRAAYLKLQAFLAKMPDARSLLGGDGYRLSAGEGDGRVTLQWGGKEPSGLLGSRRVALSLSAPLKKGGNSRLFDSAFGLGESPEFGASVELVRALGIGENLLQASIGAFSSYEKHNTLVATGSSYSEVETKVKPWRIKLEAAMLSFDKGALVTAAIGRARKYQDGDPLTVCAALGTPCVDGLLGPTQRKDVTTFSLGYRRSFQSVAFAPRLSYAHADKSSLLELPIYFIRTADGSQFNAGLDLSWLRKRAKPGDEAKTDFSFGLFVGAPFSLLGRE